MVATGLLLLFFFFFGDGAAGAAGIEACSWQCTVGEPEKNGGLAIVKRLQFLIPNRGP